jgi:RNA polymerase sigma-70 factor (ECF subfamily)
MDPESSLDLLERARAGDADALDSLLRRYLTPLRRWAHGRLPTWARDGSDTQDIIQDAVYQTLRHISHIQADSPGALHRYLRRAVMNRIRDELRRAKRHSPADDEVDGMASRGPSPLELAIGREAVQAYESALAELPEHERELVIAHLEWGFSYEELAAVFDRPSRDAVRMSIRRALFKLAKAMNRFQSQVS